MSLSLFLEYGGDLVSKEIWSTQLNTGAHICVEGTWVSYSLFIFVNEDVFVWDI